MSTNLLLPSPYILGMNRETGLSQNAVAFNTTTVYPAANRALYMPFYLPSTQLILSVSIYCSVVGGGNFDLGLINSTCTTLLASLGSTALSTTGIKTWTLVTPIQVLAGQRGYIGMSCSSGTSQFLRQTSSVISLRAGSMAQEASAHPLPSSPTPAQVASAYLPTIALTFVT